MKTLHFSTVIQATPKTVWNTLFAPDTYRQWTAEFAEGSHFEGSWAKGEIIRFLGPDGGGMIAVIADNRPHEFLSIKHQGYIKDGIEDTTSPEVLSWTPAFENYTLSALGTSTELKIDMDCSEKWEDYMVRTWPKALASLKAICESSV